MRLVQRNPLVEFILFYIFAQISLDIYIQIHIKMEGKNQFSCCFSGNKKKIHQKCLVLFDL